MTWLRVVAKRVGIDYLRGHPDYIDRRRQPDASSPGAWVDVGTMPPDSQLGGDRPPVTTRGTAGELLRYADGAMPPEQRRALELWVAGEPYEEIARAVGLPGAAEAERAVRAAIERLRRRFRDRDAAPVIGCPDLDILGARQQAPEVRAHLAGCAPCRLVAGALVEREEAAEARSAAGDACARLEALLAARETGELPAASVALLDAHLARCADCAALARRPRSGRGRGGAARVARARAWAARAWAARARAARGGGGGGAPRWAPGARRSRRAARDRPRRLRAWARGRARRHGPRDLARAICASGGPWRSRSCSCARRRARRGSSARPA